MNMLGKIGIVVVCLGVIGGVIWAILTKKKSWPISMDELLRNQQAVETVNKAFCAKWIKENISDSKSKGLVAEINKFFEGENIRFPKGFVKDKHLILAIVGDKSEDICKYAMISFENMDNELKRLLENHNGRFVVEL